LESGLVRVLPSFSIAATEVTVDPNPDTRPASSPPTFTWIYVVATALALAILFVGFYRLGKDDTDAGWPMLAAGGASLVLVAVTWPLALAMNSARRGSRGDSDSADRAVADRIDKVLAQLKLIGDQQLISDRAKHVAFRDKDRDAVRRAIQEDIARQDWDAATKLADDMEREFGSKAEADRFRDEIRVKCQECSLKQVDEGLAAIDRHTRAEQWNSALREAEKLLASHPDNDRVRNLPAEIENRRQGYKRQLLDSWNEAVARHDVDGSIEILKQLDTYLTPKEAEGMQETARHIFREKLNTLGKQFATAVQEHRWAESIRVGDAIVRDFPNTRIAQEVREKMDVLRKRAAEPETATT
jgi:hypothetical protein